MLVREIMTSPAVTVSPGDEAAEAARVLDRLDVTSLPVVDGDRGLVGVIDEGDVIGQLLAPSAGDVPLVRDLMTRGAATARADDDVSSVVAAMSRSSRKSLPVLLHGRVVGVVSRRDVVRAMADGVLDARTAAGAGC